MLQKLQKRNKNQGFTIIEVMVVLAIAGLIMLIVFLVVPALERSARNTQRKADISAIAAAISNYIGENAGAVPDDLLGSTSNPSTLIVYCQGGTPNGFSWAGANENYAGYGYDYGCPNAGFNNNYETAQLGYYLPAQTSPEEVFITDVINGIPTIKVVPPGSQSRNNMSTDSFEVVEGVGCNSTNTGLSTTTNSHTAAIVYVTENGSGNGALQCLEQ